jgi:hypothetical protein
MISELSDLLAWLIGITFAKLFFYGLLALPALALVGFFAIVRTRKD